VLAAENELIQRKKFNVDATLMSINGLKRKHSPSIMKGKRFFPMDFFKPEHDTLAPLDVRSTRATRARTKNILSLDALPHFLRNQN